MRRICSNTRVFFFFLRGDLWHTCRFDFQNDREKVQKKNLLENENCIREWENVRNATDEKKQQFHITDFFKL